MVPRRRGKIINVCSLVTFQGGLTVPAYASAKGGLGTLTKALSNEWASHNVQVRPRSASSVHCNASNALITGQRHLPGLHRHRHVS